MEAGLSRKYIRGPSGHGQEEAFAKLRESADVYGVLLDLLRAHKWVNIKLATDDNFKAALKQNKKNMTVEDVVMHLRLVSGGGGSLLAEHYTRDIEKALEIADKLKAAKLRPNAALHAPRRRLEGRRNELKLLRVGSL